jgi:hypothetical protein
MVITSILEPCGITIIIILYFIFIRNFESPKTDLPIKSYAKCKLHTFQTLNLEFVLLVDLPFDVFMKFWSF